MGSEAACYLLDTRFPVDTRKLENKKTKQNPQNPNNPARAAKQAGRDFQGNCGFIFLVCCVCLFVFLMERLELHNAFVWKFGGFFPEKYVFGRRDVATSEEGRVNI